MSNPLLPIELVEQVAQKACVLFLGWSYEDSNTDILTEKVLTQKLAERIGFNNTTRTLSETAEYFEARKGTHALNQYVCDIVSNYNQPPTFYYDLLKLPFNVIVSTTLDDHEKSVLQQLGEKFHYVLSDEEIPFIESEKNIRVIVKLYGDIDNRSSMIITKDQLIGFFNKLPSISDLLKYYFSTKTLVFIGCNLDDPNFSQLYAYANQRTKGYQKRAFAIVPGASDYVKTIWERKNLAILDVDVEEFTETLAGEFKKTSVQKQITEPGLQPKTIYQLKTPYKFLNSFDEEDTNIFFGRDKEVNQALQKLIPSKLMILYGKSGYGKTSLIKAGLNPKLLANGFLPSYARCATDPLVTIKQSILERLKTFRNTESSIVPLEKSRNFSLREFILEVNKLKTGRLIVMVDQFEEFFISLGEETKRQFIHEVKECVDSSLDVGFLLSIREDFLPDLQDVRALRSLIGDSYRLKALDAQAAKVAIQGPAKKFGLTFTNAVTEDILRELSDKGQVDPAQMQIVCDRLYNRLTESSSEINESLYNDLGGVKQILADYLDEILYDFGTKRMGAAHKLLRSMVTSLFTRIPITLVEAILYTNDIPNWSEAETRDLLTDLIKVRLIRRIVDSSDESYELTHEFLISKIREWIDLEQLKVKEALDLLRQELNNWQRHQILMDRPKLEIINAQREKLLLDNRQKAFVLSAVTQYDAEFEYWLKRNEGNSLALEQLEKLLSSTSNSVKNLAGLGISIFSGDAAAINLLKLLKDSVNPNMLSRIAELKEKQFILPKDFGEKVSALVQERFTRNMSRVPAGVFLMGTDRDKIVTYIDEISDPDKRPPLSFFDGQYPQRSVEVGDFLVDKFLVTNAEYQEFKQRFVFEPGKEKHPVVGVSYFDALEYARWIGKDLPTEEEWEKAARGTDGRAFPWGNEWKLKEDGGHKVCNTSNTGHEGTTPVDMFPTGISPYGCFDMAGNVWEWTSTTTSKDYKILRGGSWSRYSLLPWCWYRFSYKPDQGYSNVGFRCIRRV